MWPGLSLCPRKSPKNLGKAGLKFELWGVLLLALGALSLLSLVFPAGAGAVGRVLDRALRVL